MLLAAGLGGVGALVAEVVWFRAIGRGIASSAQSLAVITAAFMGGLGLGALLAGRVANRTSRAFLIAACAEVGAGLLVLGSPLVLRLVPELHLAVLDTLGLEPGPTAWPAALVAAPVLLIPCVLLGSTLPLAVHAWSSSNRVGATRVGAFYGANTLGAASGVVAAAFFLLPAVGETWTLVAGATGNLAAGLLFLCLHWLQVERVEAPGTAVLASRASPPAEQRGPAGRQYALLFVAGVLGMGAEVAWFRLLEPILGMHVYGFALLLGTVLFAIGLGGWVGGVWAATSVRPERAAFVLVAAASGLMLLSLPAAGQIPWMSVRYGGADALRVVTWRTAGTAVVVAPTLFCLAAAFPLAIRAVTSPGGLARAASRLYALNTLGNVLGSILVGFLLLPVLGPSVALVLLGCMGVASALFLIGKPLPRVLGVAVAGGTLTIASSANVERQLATLGPTLSEVVMAEDWRPTLGAVESRRDLQVLAALFAGVPPRARADDEAPLLPREGLLSSVGLLEEPSGVVRLRQGGLSESRFLAHDRAIGSKTEVVLGLVPCLMSRGRQTGLVIGHGAGWTVEAALSSGLGRLDVAELEPAILDVVEAYRGTLPVRSAPNAELRITDGRLLLRRAAAAGGRYDVVVSQPSHPWVPGAGHLFTTDAYRLARASLNAGGVLAQWLNIFRMDPPLFRRAVANFAVVFEHAWLLWFGEEVVLVGFTEEPIVDLDRWQSVWSGRTWAPVLERAGLTGPEDVFCHLAADATGISRLMGSAPTSSDDDASLELGLAWNWLARRADVSPIRQVLEHLFPPTLRIKSGEEHRSKLIGRVASRCVELGLLREASLWLDTMHPSPCDETDLARARLAMRSGQAARGLEILEGLVRGGTATVEVWKTWLREKESMGSPISVLEACTEAERLGLPLTVLASYRGRAELRRGRPGSAVAVLAAHAGVLSDEPSYCEVLLQASVALGSVDERELIAEIASYGGSWTSMLVLQWLGSRELPRTSPEMGIALRAREKERDLRRAQAEIDLREGGEGLWEASASTLDLLRASTEFLRDSTTAWRLRGYVALRRGLIDEAYVCFGHAISVAEAKGTGVDERDTVARLLAMLAK